MSVVPEEDERVIEAMRRGRELFEKLLEEYPKEVLLCLCSNLRKWDLATWYGQPSAEEGPR